MAETKATILIPDISGFTEFMTTTELTHSTHAINFLMEAIVNTVGEEYEVSEIEGDAVLLIKKGPPPSKKQILDTCLKIFNAFHFQRKWMQSHTVCPCGACQAIIDLTLKFVVHHGPLAEMRVGRFVKHSGPEMIVAHRLLKNSINHNEYLLMTEKLLQQVAGIPETAEMEWISASEEYASIGKVPYQFTLLTEARKNVPEPALPENEYCKNLRFSTEVQIEANFVDAYMVIKNIPDRPVWMPGLQKVEQEIPEVYIGSLHHCTFENYRALISPLRMNLSPEGIMYAESCQIEEMNLSLVYEFVFRKTDEQTCAFIARFINAGDAPVSENMEAVLHEQMQRMTETLKEYCEKKKEPIHTTTAL